VYSLKIYYRFVFVCSHRTGNSVVSRWWTWYLHFSWLLVRLHLHFNRNYVAARSFKYCCLSELWYRILTSSMKFPWGSVAVFCVGCR
jgi:hypothetical protein